MRHRFLSCCLLFCLLSNDSVAEDLLSLYSRGMQAFQSGDYEVALSLMETAVQQTPKHPSFLYHLARAQAFTGKQGEAMNSLEQCIALGASPPAIEEPAFEALKNTPRWSRIVEGLKQNKEASGSGDVAFVIRQKDLIPEGIAYDAQTGVFYVSSTYRRKIVAVDPEGEVTDFTAEKQDGLWGVVGMEVDSKRRYLWANAGNAGVQMNMIDPDLDTKGMTGVFQYDLRTGKLIRKYELGGKEDEHFFNDMTIATTGDVFLTDSISGSIYKVSADTRELKLLLRPDGLAFPNGIGLSTDGRYLYVSHIAGISVLDLETMDFRAVDSPEDVTLSGVDGMEYYDNSLIAVGGVSGVDRVVRLYFGQDPTRIERMEVLQANHPLYQQPTTGVVAQDAFYYIANSQLRSFDEKGNIFPMKKLSDVFILKTPLRASNRDISELYHIHEEEMKAHLDTDVDLLLSRSPDEFITVNRGEISRVTREMERSMFERYFEGATYHEYEDLEPPILRISKDGSMAWMITRLHADRTQKVANGEELHREFVYAGIMTYEKQNGKWVRIANVSTFE